jgi:hypothetical protein
MDMVDWQRVQALVSMILHDLESDGDYSPETRAAIHECDKQTKEEVAQLLR